MFGLRCIYCRSSVSPYSPTVCGLCLGAAGRLAARELSVKHWGEEYVEDLSIRWHDDHRRHLVQPLINEIVHRTLKEREDPRLW